LSVRCAAAFASEGNASEQPPLSARAAACSAAFELMPAVLLETCAVDDTLIAIVKKIERLSLENLRIMSKGAAAVSVCP